ncbi:MAG TPA: hypothetical protein VFE01_00675 [Terracidiphilus sp.]|jgi:hypothetical protein|nr:hypothetical protein [Terracidiphilus sp.]
MIDYEKIAREEKSKLDAVVTAAIEKQKRDEASLAFFKSIELALAEEITKANPELARYGLLTGHRTGGISIDQKRFDTQVRLTYGRALSCEVNFDQPKSMIEVDMVMEQIGDVPVPPKKLAYCVGFTPSGTIAGKVEPGKEPSGRFAPKEIAEIVLSGMIRGNFE